MNSNSARPHVVVVNETHGLSNDRRDRPLVALRQAIKKPRRNAFEDNVRPWFKSIVLVAHTYGASPLRNMFHGLSR